MNLALFANILVLSIVEVLPNDDTVYGPPGFSRDLLRTMWRSILVLSISIVLGGYSALAPGLIMFQLVYKTLAWIVLDPMAHNPITRTNIALIPILMTSFMFQR